VLRRAEGKDFAVVATVYATDVERRFLQEEAATLADVAETKWYEIAL
jgi:hypothetical protein